MTPRSSKFNQNNLKFERNFPSFQEAISENKESRQDLSMAIESSKIKIEILEEVDELEKTGQSA